LFVAQKRLTPVLLL
jgi:hypothetical protein